MKITHFITDEKFLDDAIELLEDITELENRYVIIWNHDKPFQLLKSPLVEKIDRDEVSRIISTPSEQDAIVIHNLQSLPCEYIRQIDQQIQVVWLSWGFDIYNNEYPQFPLAKLNNPIKTQSLTPRYRLRHLNEQCRVLRKRLFHPQREKRQEFIDAIHRVDYFSGVIPTEYDILREHPFFRAQSIAFNYPSNKAFFLSSDIYKDVKQQGRLIQVGHSGTVWGNHLDTFKRLRNINIADRKVVVPLNYGGDSLYRSIVLNKGKKQFGDLFMPLTTFMPVQEYFSLIKSVAVTIYNFERQAAFGNIKINLWNGTKVFFPEHSINYRFFRNIGMKVFSIESQLNQEEIDTPLSEDDILHNRELIVKYGSFDAIKEKNRKSFLFIQSQK